MQLPSILVPYPAAMDNHQYYNALAFEKDGAALLTPQRGANPEGVAARVAELMQSEATREKMRTALACWHIPDSAEQIAASIMEGGRGGPPMRHVVMDAGGDPDSRRKFEYFVGRFQVGLGFVQLKVGDSAYSPQN